MNVRTMLQHIYKQGKITDYQFTVINRNLKDIPQKVNCKKCVHFPVCMWNGQKQDDCAFYQEEEDLLEYSDKLWKLAYERGKAEGANND